MGYHACDCRFCSHSNRSIWTELELGTLLKRFRVRFFYDPDTVLRSSENILRVWWKEVFKTKEVLRSRGFTGSEYDKAVYQVNVTEIHCQKKESRRKFFMLCSETGESILCNIHRRQLEEWVPVWRVRPTGVLYRELCR